MAGMWLVEIILQGDIARYKDIVDEYEKLVYGYCYMVLDDKNNSMEMTKHIFVTAYKKLYQYEASVSFKEWLLKIADKAMASKEKNVRIEEKINIFDSDLNVRGLIDELNVIDRKILFFNSCNISFKNIANIFGLNEEMVRKKYSFSMDKLHSKAAKPSDSVRIQGSCKRFTNMLWEYICNDVLRKDLPELNKHLEQCQLCSKELQDRSVTNDLIMKAFEDMKKTSDELNIWNYISGEINKKKNYSLLTNLYNKSRHKFDKAAVVIITAIAMICFTKYFLMPSQSPKVKETNKVEAGKKEELTINYNIINVDNKKVNFQLNNLKDIKAVEPWRFSDICGSNMVLCNDKYILVYCVDKGFICTIDVTAYDLRFDKKSKAVKLSPKGNYLFFGDSADKQYYMINLSSSSVTKFSLKGSYDSLDASWSNNEKYFSISAYINQSSILNMNFWAGSFNREQLINFKRIENTVAFTEISNDGYYSCENGEFININNKDDRFNINDLRLDGNNKTPLNAISIRNGNVGGFIQGSKDDFYECKVEDRDVKVVNKIKGNYEFLQDFNVHGSSIYSLISKDNSKKVLINNNYVTELDNIQYDKVFSGRVVSPKLDKYIESNEQDMIVREVKSDKELLWIKDMKRDAVIQFLDNDTLILMKNDLNKSLADFKIYKINIATKEIKELY